jgi:hypothetical protein
MSHTLSFSCSPTVNVDVGGTTVWTVHNADGPLAWSCPDEGTIVRLEPQDSNGIRCKITGLAGGQTEIIVQERGGDHQGAKKSIGVGLIFAYAPDGSLYAVSAAAFKPVDSTQASHLPIPTLEQMATEEAYYVPYTVTVNEADANVTCYVINLGYIKTTDVWPPITPGATSKKSDK